VATTNAVDIRTDWLAGEPPLPDHCVLHGLPAVQQVTFAVKSNPKVGSAKKVLAPGYTAVHRASEYLNQVKIVKATGWPLCARCMRLRIVGLTAAAAVLLAGLALLMTAVIIGAIADPPPGVIVLLFLSGFAVTLLSVVPFQRVSLPRLTHAEVTADGSAVHVPSASPEFTTRLPASAKVDEDTPSSK
jgi:hypothetical protein